VLAQEAAFVGDLVPGGQAMFGRIRVDGLKPLTTRSSIHFQNTLVADASRKSAQLT
jgi:hypothetical protein